MQKQNQSKLFAFKLAEKQEQKPEQWKVRDGVAAAGCSGPVNYDNYRADGLWNQPDKGYYC